MIEITDIAIVPLNTAIVEVIKRLGVLSDRVLPIVSLVTGIILSVLLNPTASVREMILKGIVYGLSASGLYSGQKAVRDV